MSGITFFTPISWDYFWEIVIYTYCPSVCSKRTKVATDGRYLKYRIIENMRLYTNIMRWGNGRTRGNKHRARGYQDGIVF